MPPMPRMSKAKYHQQKFFAMNRYCVQAAREFVGNDLPQLIYNLAKCGGGVVWERSKDWAGDSERREVDLTELCCVLSAPHPNFTKAVLENQDHERTWDRQIKIGRAYAKKRRMSLRRKKRNKNVYREPVPCAVCKKEQKVRPSKKRKATFYTCYRCNFNVTMLPGFIHVQDTNAAGNHTGHTIRKATDEELAGIARARMLLDIGTEHMIRFHAPKSPDSD